MADSIMTNESQNANINLIYLGVPPLAASREAATGTPWSRALDLLGGFLGGFADSGPRVLGGDVREGF